MRDNRAIEKPQYLSALCSEGKNARLDKANKPSQPVRMKNSGIYFGFKMKCLKKGKMTIILSENNVPEI